MAWEAGQTGSARRLRLTQCVVKHRALPQDPLAFSGGDDNANDPALAALLEPQAGDPGEPLDAINLF